jgi:N-ethylmaleimide reductase
MMKNENLFSIFKLGDLHLPNRAVMAPMTRNRAAEGFVPTPLMATYYMQRASAGLIVTEASQVAPEGQGYPNTPGIYSAEQMDGWELVTDAVHKAGGRIFLQLWHVGRISHPLYQPEGALPVAPSAIAPKGKVYTTEGLKEYVTPRALDLGEIPGVVHQYRQAAINAKAAGFDGVEIHAANGYLIDQFLRDGTNQRTDIYGGSVENRVRFLLEITNAVISVWGKNRVGVRLSPSNTFNDMRDSDPVSTFGHAIKELNKLGIVYVHLIEGSIADIRHGGEKIPTEKFRPLFQQTLIVNNGYSYEKANDVIASGEADLVAFGVPFLANPDLLERFKTGAPLNNPDPKTFYGGTEKGYTDYPALAGALK